MRDIIMTGSVEHLVKLMKEDGFELCRTEIVGTDEQMWIFATDYCSYEYEAKVTFQVNELDERNLPLSINVVKVEGSII